MREHPILFSGEMVRAILEGRKTQTRRIVRPQPPDGMTINGCPWVKSGWALHENDGRVCTCKQVPYHYGFPGETLWVREKWNAQTQSGKWWHEVKRDDRQLLNWAWTNPVEPVFESTPPRWLPSIHMPREASRITLEIIDVHVERVQEICIHDVWAEGIKAQDVLHLSRGQKPSDIINTFATLWNVINDHRGYGWDINPWVWVIGFKVI